MTARRSLSIVMPALDEAASIERAIRVACAAASRRFDDYEVIVVDDGSSDGTGQTVARLMATNARLRLVSHDRPRGFGASYDSGRRAARMNWTVMVQGDGPFTEETLDAFFAHAGEADVICGYWQNPGERSPARQLVSRWYTAIVNRLFGYGLRYYNGLQIHSTAWLDSLELTSTGFGFQAEVLLAALDDGRSLVEVPTNYLERPDGGASKAFRLRNIVSTLRTLVELHRARRARRRRKGR